MKKRDLKRDYINFYESRLSSPWNYNNPVNVFRRLSHRPKALYLYIFILVIFLITIFISIITKI